jgi:hypothetical protein
MSTGVPSGEAPGFGVAKGGGGVKPPLLQANGAKLDWFNSHITGLDAVKVTLERTDLEYRAWRSEAEHWKFQAELWKTSYSEERKLTRFLLVIFVIMLVPVAIAAAVLVNLYVG